jgi:hypothetical protein
VIPFARLFRKVPQTLLPIFLLLIIVKLCELVKRVFLHYLKIAILTTFD